MPDMATPRRTLKVIICRQDVMKAVDSVMMPKSVVMVAKKIRGPTMRRQMVAGSWKHIEDTVNMKIATL